MIMSWERDPTSNDGATPGQQEIEVDNEDTGEIDILKFDPKSKKYIKAFIWRKEEWTNWLLQ